MGELREVAHVEMGILRDKLHAQAMHRKNITLLKKEVQREAQEFKKLQSTR